MTESTKTTESKDEINPIAMEAVKEAKQTSAALKKARAPKQPPKPQNPVKTGEPTLADLVRESQDLTRRMKEQGLIGTEGKRTRKSN